MLFDKLFNKKKKVDAYVKDPEELIKELLTKNQQMIDKLEQMQKA